jgi:hypothetical protein
MTIYVASVSEILSTLGPFEADFNSVIHAFTRHHPDADAVSRATGDDSGGLIVSVLN